WAISRSGSRKNHSMPAASAVAGTAAAAQRPERRARARLTAAVATVGRSHGDAPRARRTRPRGAEVWLWGMNDLRSGMTPRARGDRGFPGMLSVTGGNWASQEPSRYPKSEGRVIFFSEKPPQEGRSSLDSILLKQPTTNDHF